MSSQESCKGFGMIADLDIYRAAYILVKEYGVEQAPLMAAKRAEAMLTLGDVDGQRTWKAVLRGVQELTRTERGPQRTAQGHCSTRVRYNCGLVSRPSRPLPSGSRDPPRRGPRQERRSVPAPARHRHHDASRQGAIPDDGRVRRVRARDHPGKGECRARASSGIWKAPWPSG
jgi:hypothetical protein